MNVIFKVPYFVSKAVRIALIRLRTQGIRITCIWVIARSASLITGRPLLRFCRITPQLYVGPQFRKGGKKKLEQAGIHACVNLRIEFDDALHGLALANYCYLPTVDDDPPSIEQIGEGIAFINRIIEQGEKVYIHCHGGIGRAPTMAVAYFLSKGLSLDEVIELIKTNRPYIRIMPKQLEMLKQFATSYGDGK